FDLLKVVGKDSVCAIALLSPEIPYQSEPILYEVLEEQKLDAVLSDYKSEIPLGLIEHDDDFRISVAGVQ
ncbi:type II toxin-antitoxin system HipA family toxin, partial [Psychromonas aquatilis]